MAKLSAEITPDKIKWFLKLSLSSRQIITFTLLFFPYTCLFTQTTTHFYLWMKKKLKAQTQFSDAVFINKIWFYTIWNTVRFISTFKISYYLLCQNVNIMIGSAFWIEIPLHICYSISCLLPFTALWNISSKRNIRINQPAQGYQDSLMEKLHGQTLMNSRITC